jgi:hypothetical protein
MHFQKGLKEDNKELENPYVWGNIQESLRMAQARAPADSSRLEVACLYSVPVRTFGQKCLFVCLCRMHEINLASTQCEALFCQVHEAAVTRMRVTVESATCVILPC